MAPRQERDSSDGYHRQLVSANFIVDFACTNVRLVVEVDGGYHRQPRDAARDRTLTRSIGAFFAFGSPRSSRALTASSLASLRRRSR